MTLSVVLKDITQNSLLETPATQEFFSERPGDQFCVVSFLKSSMRYQGMVGVDLKKKSSTTKENRKCNLIYKDAGLGLLRLESPFLFSIF